jgi:O-antigen/teichoic acid export membrane protein
VPQCSKIDGDDDLFGLARPFNTTQRSEQFQRRLRILLVYMTGQGLVQIISLSLGLLLLRWLTVDNYAQFSVAFGFQSTLGMLTDMGFAGTIIALVGARGNDPNIVGSYIRSGRRLRNVMMACLTPVAAIVFVGIARQHHWELLPSTLLFISIVSSIYFNGMVSYYGAPLLIRGRLSHYYRHQLAGAAFRIVACGILYLTGNMNAWTTSWANSLGFLLIGWLNARESRPFAALPDHHIPEVTRQMVRYVMPNLPNIIFYALQGQISLFLISFFGQTRSIAEVGALGRLGQIFILLSGFNGAVIEPFMARLPEKQVLRKFLIVFAAASAICAVICLVGFFEPRLLLLLLGARYASLQRETGWLALGSSIGYLATVAWTVCGARRWLFWTTSCVNIGMTITAQVVFLFLFRVDTTLHVIWFGVASASGYLISALFNVVYGLKRGSRSRISEASTVEKILE